MQTEIMNVPSKAGQKAGAYEIFGAFARYAVFPVHTRFDAIEWFVVDSEREDPVCGGMAIIRQEPTRELAMAGLEVTCHA